MTLVIDLSPQKEKQLRDAIAVNDMEQMRQVLEPAINDLIATLLQKSTPLMTEAEWERELDALAEFVDMNIPDDVPVLSDYALTREGIYRDHP